jgi:GNAT superfamily N-acetyltransferase
VDIVEVTSSSLMREFVELPYAMYARHRQWVPPLRRDERRRLSAAHNAFFDHADIRCWIARAGRQAVGRVAAINDRLHDERHAERVTWFGFFEADDGFVAQALLTAVEQSARARRSAVVRGPANPSLNESAGLLIDGFDSAPYILMPYNPPSYRGFVEAAGYHKAKDLYAWHIEVAPAPPPRIARSAARVRRRSNVVLRALRPEAFDRELATVLQIYQHAWADNWGFVAPTAREVEHLAAELRPVVDPALVIFAEVDSRPVGCAVAVPDANQILKRMNGRLLPFGIWHYLRRRSIVDQLRLFLLGVLPEARHIGLYPVLIDEAYRRALAGGYRRAELSWTLEDNDAINKGIEAAGGRRYKTYRLYETALG